ncbi:hypothetical protein [Pseudarthrobacter phenanthrenivorans]|jgi:hypothetical protein|uniref:Uncharacterized protein n=1 Tax=Pseudarthrobacter phenanthrenivorans TaxID=361575 RepID=A0A0B4ERT9_PSEPS|nr:hypothetical protein [Pseudarthrobacter phenanthrenivorans]KIC69433.1 hypothetical protein RM50_01760 [Pseudarthrobacter phenanthrenivorans]
MPFVFLSISAVAFVASMVLYDQWLMADRRGKSGRYRKGCWISMWAGLALTAAFVLLFVATG